MVKTERFLHIGLCLINLMKHAYLVSVISAAISNFKLKFVRSVHFHYKFIWMRLHVLGRNKKSSPMTTFY